MASLARVWLGKVSSPPPPRPPTVCGSRGQTDRDLCSKEKNKCFLKRMTYREGHTEGPRKRGCLRPASPGQGILKSSIQRPGPLISYPQVLLEHPRRGTHQPDSGKKQTRDEGVSFPLSKLTTQTPGAPTGSLGPESNPAQDMNHIPESLLKLDSLNQVLG